MKALSSAILAGVLMLTAAPALAASGDRTTPKQTPAPVAAQPAGPDAPVTLDDRLGCGVMLVTIDEVLQRNPQLSQSMGKSDGGKAMLPMLRMLGASGEVLLDAAYVEGAAQGLKPTTMYRRGVANLSAAFAGVQSSTDDRVKTQAMALFTRCVSIAAPKS